MLQQNQKVYCLYVNITSFYTSFKIEEGKYLGQVYKDLLKEKFHAVEHTDDDVYYL